MRHFDPLKHQLNWLSMTSGEDVPDWRRVSQGDIVCFILFRMRRSLLISSPREGVDLHQITEGVDLQQMTDGVDRFARVTNWRIANRAMRKLGMGFPFDEVKLVQEDVPELSSVIRAIKRWETRNLVEPLEPITPEEWDDEDLPSWFQQLAAKRLEEKRLAAGEFMFKKITKVREVENITEKYRKKRVDMFKQMGRKTALAKERPKPKYLKNINISNSHHNTVSETF